MKKLQYFITAVWGFLTPSLAFDGARQALAMAKGGEEARAQATPAEHVLFLLLAAFACVLAFLLYDALFSAFALPRHGKRFRHFILNVILFVLLVPLGWLAVTLLSPGIGP